MELDSQKDTEYAGSPEPSGPSFTSWSWAAGQKINLFLAGSGFTQGTGLSSSMKRGERSPSPSSGIRAPFP